MGKTYKHLFFDLDHTLWDFDSNSEQTLKKLYQEYDLESIGITDFDAFYQVYNTHNDRLWERFRNGFIKREELRWKRIWYTLLDFKIGDTSLAYEMSAAYLEILPTQKMLMPHAKELLDYCSGRYTMHLITNGFETTQWQKMQFSGIAGYFQEVITSEKSNSLKPHREIFEYALAAAGAKAEESIMIGDAIDIDILGAINAGWDQVYFNPKKLTHSRKPTYEIACLSDLMKVF
ncbi:YjjG family noncanonical pyrimidine nucleotidase [Taibaiella soli]|uniref:Noncanonical pyrimidine nucleotidase, YjjG family n=1 Tax=Taibaiella soli TaxID=1649169 RepID=A0A2W2AX84_9BACT|nr:YjjG family noncanonical pyrimidine nucleotidase [Taibaiella soli]PZF72328.1 noncanonical pyrimidine nucleotidase, YjjG family [Taibaiella soli]